MKCQLPVAEELAVVLCDGWQCGCEPESMGGGLWKASVQAPPIQRNAEVRGSMQALSDLTHPHPSSCLICPRVPSDLTSSAHTVGTEPWAQMLSLKSKQKIQLQAERNV